MSYAVVQECRGGVFYVHYLREGGQPIGIQLDHFVRHLNARGFVARFDCFWRRQFGK